MIPRAAVVVIPRSAVVALTAAAFAASLTAALLLSTTARAHPTPLAPCLATAAPTAALLVPIHPTARPAAV